MRLLILLSLIIIPFTAQANDKELIVGAWDMIKFEVQNDNEVWEELVIENTTLIGSIVFTKAGIMHVQMVSTDRANEEINANGEIENGYSAYFGHYSMNTQERIVTYNRLGHIVDKYKDAIVNRHYDVGQKHLHIYNSPTARMIWKRVE
ncbi:MAG: lipocalin-like domain-containing protein [Emcibacteraceae bacterium]|nr:lipocalin-like domain-containing protein [Emcibacteraceae bacterium]MDG1857768.1 lipocalin-like domain-containing protein [Emcibacteraceae bacterium]